MESLILAQNERLQRGLGMQVERETISSILRERRDGGKWRKGEEHVGNLSLSWGQPAERRANTECGPPMHIGVIKGGDLSGPAAGRGARALSVCW